MKNVKRILSIISLTLVITLTLVSCGGGGGSGPAPALPAKEPQKTIYRSEDAATGDVYRLEVTEKVAGRAAYTPQKGDTYVLTIIYKDKRTLTSSGTVQTAGGTLTLQPTVAPVTTFTITISGSGMTTISGTITFDPEEGKVAETKVITTITLTVKPLTETDNMDLSLAAKPANTPATAYSYKLKIYNEEFWELLDLLGKYSNKYVKLDLSESTLEGFGFWDCKTLVSITLPNTIISINGWSFIDCTNLTSVKLPNSIKAIENGTFSGCTSLTSITIPDSVTSIGKWAFQDSGLTGINIPDSVTVIEDDAFLRCINLANLTIGNGVIEIMNAAFNGSGLKTVIIGSGVKYIGDWAFLTDPEDSLKSVTFKSAGIEFGEWPFHGGLHDKYSYEGPGTYISSKNGDEVEWTKQP